MSNMLDTHCFFDTRLWLLDTCTQLVAARSGTPLTCRYLSCLLWQQKIPDQNHTIRQGWTGRQTTSLECQQIFLLLLIMSFACYVIYFYFLFIFGCILEERDQPSPHLRVCDGWREPWMAFDLEISESLICLLSSCFLLLWRLRCDVAETRRTTETRRPELTRWTNWDAMQVLRDQQLTYLPTPSWNWNHSSWLAVFCL